MVAILLASSSCAERRARSPRSLTGSFLDAVARPFGPADLADALTTGERVEFGIGQVEQQRDAPPQIGHGVEKGLTLAFAGINLRGI